MRGRAPFRALLVANRGEIAVRVIRACREAGIRAVAVFSEADRGAPWLDAADARVCIGPARADLSYLDADAVLQAAEQTGCQAIHPGYGFLSENARFAARCAQHGLAFIGPTAAAIRRMGDKVRAKEAMARAGLPTIPLGFTEFNPNVPQGKSPFDIMTDFAIFGSVTFETLAVATIFVFRRRIPPTPENRPYRCWGYPLVPALYIAIMCAVLVNFFVSPQQRTEALVGMAFIALGAAVYRLVFGGRAAG